MSDETFRSLERAWLASPEDREAGEAYVRAWQRAGEPSVGNDELLLQAWVNAGTPGRDPRRHPLPGDIVEAYVKSRYSSGDGWEEVRRFEVIDVEPGSPTNKTRVKRRYLGRRKFSINGTFEPARPRRAGSFFVEPGEVFEDSVLIGSWRAWAGGGRVLRRLPRSMKPSIPGLRWNEDDR